MSRHATIIQASLETDVQLFTVPGGGEDLVRRPSGDYGRLIAALWGGSQPCNVVAFTSASPHEGVTYTVTRVAAELERRLGCRVAVVAGPELRSNSDVQPAWLPGTDVPSRRKSSTDPVATLQTQHDIVLIDAGSVAEGAIIGPGVDGVIIVVEARKTTRRDLHRTITAIRTGQGRVVGLVLNRHRPVLPAWLERLLG